MTPTGSVDEPLQHSFTAPALENASVLDVMRLGVVSCPPDTPLRELARILASYRIHSVVITQMEGGRPWGIVTDLDLVAAAGDDVEKRTARDVARTEVVRVAADEKLARAAQLMVEHDTAHLVVVQPHSGHPVGVLSTLDVAGVLAWGGGG